MKAKRLTVKLSHDRFARDLERESLGCCWQKQLVSRFRLSPSVGSTTSARLILVFPFFCLGLFIESPNRYLCSRPPRGEPRHRPKRLARISILPSFLPLKRSMMTATGLPAPHMANRIFVKSPAPIEAAGTFVVTCACRPAQMLPFSQSALPPAGRSLPSLAPAENEVRGGVLPWGCGHGGLVQLSSFSRLIVPRMLHNRGGIYL